MRNLRFFLRKKITLLIQKKSIISVFLIALLMPMVASADAWDNQRAKALAWLLNEQNQQGYWSADRKRFVATAEVLNGFENSGIKLHSSYQRGFSWLANIKAHSVDSLARQTRILANNNFNTDDYIAELDVARAVRWGWGSYSKSDSDALDTALALHAYLVSSSNSNSSSISIGKGLCYLSTTNAKVQSFSNGNWTDTSPWGWSYTTVRSNSESRWSKNPAIAPTVYAILALAQKIDNGGASIGCGGVILDNGSVSGTLRFDYRDTILRGVKWLRNLYVGGQYKQPSGDGGPINTALALIALNKARELGIVGTGIDGQLAAARNYLISSQQPNGSWQQDAFTTGLVLQALPTASMQDSDGDYLPDLVETLLGSDPNDSDSGFVGGIDNSFNLPGYYGLAAKNIPFSDSYTIPSINGETISPPYSWTGVSGTLPPGVSLNSGSTPNQAARLSGTPSVGGNYSFVYEVTGANFVKGRMSGWLSVRSDHSDNADDDEDGIPSLWELENGFNPLSNSDANGDADNDGLTNYQEYRWGLDPRSNDTDNDGIDDKFEVTDNNKYSPGTSLHPLVATDAALDFDSDDLSNLTEYQLGTDLRNPDTDGDGILDGDEVAAGMDPLVDEELTKIVVIIIITSMLL